MRGAKLHPQVGRFGLDDPRLDPLYERAIEHGALLLIHAGRRPEPNEHVGARAFARLMRRFPRLKVVVAHAGADEFDAFFDLCGLYEGVFLDTAMVFNNFLGGPPPIQRVLEFQDRVVFGSDFPNIPYRFESAIQSHPRPAPWAHARGKAAVHQCGAFAGPRARLVAALNSGCAGPVAWLTAAR